LTVAPCWIALFQRLDQGAVQIEYASEAAGIDVQAEVEIGRDSHAEPARQVQAEHEVGAELRIDVRAVADVLGHIRSLKRVHVAIEILVGKLLRKVLIDLRLQRRAQMVCFIDPFNAGIERQPWRDGSARKYRDRSNAPVARLHLEVEVQSRAEDGRDPLVILPGHTGARPLPGLPSGLVVDVEKRRLLK